jgi:hypothetical protein
MIQNYSIVFPYRPQPKEKNIHFSHMKDQLYRIYFKGCSFILIKGPGLTIVAVYHILQVTSK